MLPILFVVFLALGGVCRAEVYDGIETKSYVVRTKRRNPYFSKKLVDEDGTRVTYLNILQDITPELGLQLSTMMSVSRARGNDVEAGPDYQDFCSALDNYVNDDSMAPRADEVLALKGQQCPLKKGLYKMPAYELPNSIDLNYEADCSSVQNYVVSIEDKDSTSQKPNSYVQVYVEFTC